MSPHKHGLEISSGTFFCFNPIVRCLAPNHTRHYIHWHSHSFALVNTVCNTTDPPTSPEESFSSKCIDPRLSVHAFNFSPLEHNKKISITGAIYLDPVQNFARSRMPYIHQVVGWLVNITADFASIKLP